MISDYIHPSMKKSIRALLAALNTSADATPMTKVIPFPQYPLPTSYASQHPSVSPVPSTLTYWTFSSLNTSGSKKIAHRKTLIMATLNTTPDSFSDGSTHNTLETGLAYAREAVNGGATIIDVGGYSTRPGAAFVSEEDEVARVVPFVGAIRGQDSEMPRLVQDVLISVDTFRWGVARAAIQAGANCINDVYAFAGRDSYPFSCARPETEESIWEMKSVAREFAVPVVLMHSRGDAGKNKDYAAYEYAPEIVVEGIRVELGEKMDMIVKGKGGVRRWLVIADPGIGFSKTVEGNLEVLRSASNVTADVEIGEGQCQFISSKKSSTDIAG